MLSMIPVYNKYSNLTRSTQKCGLFSISPDSHPLMTPFIYFIVVSNILRSTSELCQKSEFLFLKLNFFSSIPPTIDEYQLQNQRISTRLFIFLLTISLSILLLYTSLINITQTVNIKAPLLQEYLQLYNLHSQTLACECTQISTNYEKFINIDYKFHQVCHSDFVTQDWSDYLATLPGNNGNFYDNFRVTSTFAFQGLNTLCILVNQTISNRLHQFYSSQYVSAYVTPSHVFQLQTKVFISQFKLSTTNDFLLSLAMIRKTTQSNALLSGQLTNYKLYTYANAEVFTKSLWYGDCTCASSATCVSQYEIVDYPNVTRMFIVPGFYLGCYTIEALLQSDLQCFYDQTCIDNLLSYFQVSSIMNVTALDMSLSNHFLENATIESVLNELMVEEWNSSSMYDKYYNECQPKQCSYTRTTKNSAIYIVTTVIGLIGGLITVLKVIMPMLVNFTRRHLRKERRSETGMI